MSDRKIQVPDGMIDAVFHSQGMTAGHPATVRKNLEAAMRWLSENPIVPTEQQAWSMQDEYDSVKTKCSVQFFFAVEWQRRMFLAPDPKTCLGRTREEWQRHIDELFGMIPEGGTIPESALLHAWPGTVTDDDRAWADKKIAEIAPDPDEPIRDLLCSETQHHIVKQQGDFVPSGYLHPDTIDGRIREAHRRGREGK
jgi:hypothetical protein